VTRIPPENPRTEKRIAEIVRDGAGESAEEAVEKQQCENCVAEKRYDKTGTNVGRQADVTWCPQIRKSKR
jgi:hypothetical protein